MRRRTLLTDRFNKPTTILGNPAVFEGASLSDLCGIVANDFSQFRRGNWWACAFSGERCPDACFMRTLQSDLGTFGSKDMRESFVGLIDNHLEG